MTTRSLTCSLDALAMIPGVTLADLLAFAAAAPYEAPVEVTWATLEDGSQVPVTESDSLPTVRPSL